MYPKIFFNVFTLKSFSMFLVFTLKSKQKHFSMFSPYPGLRLEFLAAAAAAAATAAEPQLV
jgi:hypothetical protein